MSYIKNLANSLLHLFYPEVCEGCGNDLSKSGLRLCIYCMTHLPKTSFERFENNPIEKIFFGRIPLLAAASFCYFTRRSVVQRLLHQLKYRNDKELGLLMGEWMGRCIEASGRFNNIQLLVPVPLHPSRLKSRGYNQSALLCQGISSVLGVPVAESALKRKEATDSQTSRSRVARWENMKNRFELTNVDELRNKEIMLVDDVITTGATLEACSRAISEKLGSCISLFSFAYAATKF
ncbi:MAG TPA: ComF family protein [Parasegetibacter sp.]|jgi:ComF family protein